MKNLYKYACLIELMASERRARRGCEPYCGTSLERAIEWLSAAAKGRRPDFANAKRRCPLGRKSRSHLGRSEALAKQEPLTGIGNGQPLMMMTGRQTVGISRVN